MKRSRFSEEQIVYAIRQAESGTPAGDLSGSSASARPHSRPGKRHMRIWA
jgi:hypothetical protein